MKRTDFEIMAPVGSFESLAAALAAGADAVYFGIEGLNMRSRSSSNFSLDDLREIVKQCSEKNVKTYLTVNTIIYDADIPYLRSILNVAKEAGISAIIATDISTILYARKIGLEVHISTQANLSNYEAVEYFARFADVMVLARELNLDQVKEIHRRILENDLRGPAGELIRLEMFCHGALCMAVSGKCYLSLHEMNSSANRGACNQICRRAYKATDMETGDELAIENKYIMSPKDLKTIHFLDRMVEAGVTVFKIEGRARGPEYVYETVRCYSEALEAICQGDFSDSLLEGWEGRLAKVFNRGFWDGYYLGQRLGEWSKKYGSSATRVKQYVAKAQRYFSKLGVGEFRMEAGELHPGDEVIVTGPTTGALIFRAEELRLELDPVSEVRKGQVFSMPVPAKIRPSDRLYIWLPTESVQKIKGVSDSDLPASNK
ncbi:MAG: U32 family peptidase [Muribaculaceae bacterium]|nr:U32 family peptidase [Muribaculaceae bacterium]